MKIVLISPKGPLYRHRRGIFKRSLRYAPLTLTTLAALVPEELNARIELIDEGIELVDEALNADIIGMTVITGCARRAYELSDHFRKRGSKVVLGGPHVTLAPEDALPHADSIVTGYAEDTWPQLLKDFSRGAMKLRYDQSPSLSLAGRPLPRRDLLPANKFITNSVFEATRGCVHKCDFCVVPSAWGRKPLQKPVEEVVEDICRHQAKRIIFVDLNLIADVAYAKTLFEALIPLKIHWYGLTTVSLVDHPSLLDLAVRSGCRGLLMGLESLSSGNLTSSSKGFNDPAGFKRVTEKLHRNGISLQGCFVFGLDQDGPEVFLKTARFAVDAKIDLPRFAIVTPFPGTALYQRLKSEGRILTHNWDLYDGQHVVFQPAGMSVECLQEGLEKAWLYAYRWSSMARRLTGLPRSFPINLAANLGYRYYAHHLKDTYHCDWFTGSGNLSYSHVNPPLRKGEKREVS